MKSVNNFRATTVTYHRNGISGRPFYAVQFSFEDEDMFHPNMLAVIPAANGDAWDKVECEIAVIDMNAPTECWRGTSFVDDVIAAIKKDGK